MAASTSLRPATPSQDQGAVEVQQSPVPVKSAHLELQPQSNQQALSKSLSAAESIVKPVSAQNAKDIYSLADRELAAKLQVRMSEVNKSGTLLI